MTFVKRQLDTHNNATCLCRSSKVFFYRTQSNKAENKVDSKVNFLSLPLTGRFTESAPSLQIPTATGAAHPTAETHPYCKDPPLLQRPTPIAENPPWNEVWRKVVGWFLRNKVKYKRKNVKNMPNTNYNIIFHYFLTVSRRGSHVKSDYVHTIIQPTPLSPYTRHRALIFSSCALFTYPNRIM